MRLDRVARFGVLLTLAIASAAHAQGQVQKVLGGYPDKPIRFLVASIPGAASDVVVRMVTPRVQERLGVSMVIENRGGANGLPALNAASQATPDGYTILLSGNLLLLNGVSGKLPYDVRKTFDPVVLLTSQPYLLLAHPSLPVATFKELVAYAKSRPGTVNYGSSGLGSVNHLGTALLADRLGVDMVHVPYKGNAQALPDLVSGRIQLLFTSGPSATPHIKSGKAKPLAISSLNRSSAFPDIPSVSELGIKGFDVTNTYTVYAPAGTPAAIQSLLNREFTESVNSPEVKGKLAPHGVEFGRGTAPAALRKAFLEEYETWARFLKAAGLRLHE
jgi:tripartite-type tricarboxylate transporter receptor subunit TctC